MARVRIASMPPDTSCVNALIVWPTAAGAAAADAAELLSRAQPPRAAASRAVVDTKIELDRAMREHKRCARRASFSCSSIATGVHVCQGAWHAPQQEDNSID